MRGWMFVPFLLAGLFITSQTFFFKLDSAQAFLPFLWWLFFAWLGHITHLVFWPLLQRFPDRGLALARVLGPLCLTYLWWLPPHLGLGVFSALQCLLTVLLFAVGGAFSLARNKADISWFYTHHAKKILGADLLFFFMFLAWAITNALHPEIFWGEKPMDLSFLGNLIRRENLPLEDPWFAGGQPHYYYMGYLMFAGVAKILNTPLDVSYLLAMATVVALWVVAIFSLLRSFFSFKLALLTSALLPFLANWKSVQDLIMHGPATFQRFWSATRVFPNNFFAEWPAWSFLFLDLHPHVMGYPVLALFLGVAITVIKETDKNISSWLLLAFLGGAILAFNAWDLPVAFGTAALFSLLWSSLRPECMRARFKRVVALVLAALIGILLWLPMFTLLRSGGQKQWGVVREPLIDLPSLWHHEGQWLLIIGTLSLIVMLRRNFRFSLTNARWGLVVWPFFALELYFQGMETFSNLPFFLVLSLVTTLVGLASSRLHKDKRLGLLGFYLTGLGGVLVSRHFFFMDQMNTIFKIFNNVWVFFALCSLFLINEKLIGRARIAKWSVSALAVTALFLGHLSNFWGISSYWPYRGERPTLRGLAFREKLSEDEAQLIAWINKEVKGVPLLLESDGRSFDHRSVRIASNTGLSTVLGWHNHVRLRGAPQNEIGERARWIASIYSSHDAIKSYEALRKRGVEYVVVGNKERERFGADALKKFEQFRELFDPVFKRGAVTLYQVRAQ